MRERLGPNTVQSSTAVVSTISEVLEDRVKPPAVGVEPGPSRIISSDLEHSDSNVLVLEVREPYSCHKCQI
jgi:hypothetical protein